MASTTSIAHGLAATDATQAGAVEAVRAAIDLRRFVPLIVQLALLLVIFHQFNVESEAFFRLATACVVAFAIHYFLPFEIKKQGLIGLTILGALYALVQIETGSPLLNQILMPMATIGSILALSIFFYYALNMRMPFAVRLLPVLAVAGVLALARHYNIGGLPNLFWAIVGSVFMFRLVIYAYDVRMSRHRESLTDFLSYILLLPNFYFTLFPVVDYSTFQRTWYARDIHVMAQEGIFWIVRGTIQLMIYRLLYHRVVIGPHDVVSFWTMLQYVFPTYLLYLKISGHFHIIVGMMKLFGYDLPETHRMYLLASSFTDFWRRINIYWKDFMIKCFFYPVHFRLRRKNETLALIAGTIAVFVATTVLHGYQWFWLRGNFHITGPDVLFWSILGCAVIVNVLIETRRRPKLNAAPKPKWFTVGVHVLKVIAMYITISVLWSMWSTQSISDWINTVMYWR